MSADQFFAENFRINKDVYMLNAPAYKDKSGLEGINDHLFDQRELKKQSKLNETGSYFTQNQGQNEKVINELKN
jgi:hypothetical protein